MAPSKKKRDSGGKREGDKKRAAAAAENGRPPNFKAQMLEARRALGPPPTDPRKRPLWLGAVADLMVYEAMTDPGPKLEASREQTMRGVDKAHRTVDAAKLTAELAELHAAVMGGKPADAAEESSGDAGGTPPPPPLQ